MTFTLTISTVCGLAFAVFILYIWCAIATEEAESVCPGVSVPSIIAIQFVGFLVVYGLMALLGL